MYSACVFAKASAVAMWRIVLKIVARVLPAATVRLLRITVGCRCAGRRKDDSCAALLPWGRTVRCTALSQLWVMSAVERRCTPVSRWSPLKAGTEVISFCACSRA